jgi:acetyl esterase/lipase
MAPDCPAANYDLHNDLAYASGPDQLLDLLVPRDAPGPVPVVVWIHGGGWQSGDKTNREQAVRLVCRGYAVAAINYRLSGTAIFPAQIHDVKAAIRFLRARAATYLLDPQRIAAFGSSAGGHLAALAGTSSGVSALEDLTQGNAPQSSRVQAVIDWYGPTQLTSMDSQLLAQGCSAGSARHGEPDSPESRLLGCTVSRPDCADQARLADPAEHADAADPPMLLLHGSQDCVSPVAQSTLLAQVLGQRQACAIMRPLPGAGHGGSAWLSPEVQDTVADFLDRVMTADAPSAAR